MQQQLQQSPMAVDGGWLYVAEIVHRIGNEYTSAIASMRLAAAKSSSTEAKAALNRAAGQLGAFATAHRVMQPPLAEGVVNLADSLTRLCKAVTLASLQDRGISLSLEVPRLLLLDASRCWRTKLIVGELITNAARHAFATEGGAIKVAVTLAAGQVACEVSDNGAGPATFTPGTGTQLVDSLAAELGGHVQRRFAEHGSTVTLLFPGRPTEATQDDGSAGWANSWSPV
jgi:two-component sensor histidine kinase